MTELLKELGLSGVLPGASSGAWSAGSGPQLASYSPVDGSLLGTVAGASPQDCTEVIARAEAAFQQWRLVPAPRRGEVVRQIGLALRSHKSRLGALVSREVGKIRAEAEGEVQEMIDMADFAVGLSRMLYGRTMPSERPGHRLVEQWHPLGPVGVITAFNFPLAVWSWNAFIALVCGDSVVWKPSAKAPLSALAALKIIWPVLAQSDCPDGLLGLLMGGREVAGQALCSDRRVPLVSATGSVAMGRQVAAQVAGRLGRSILELGGNNAIIVAPTADFLVTVPAIVFGAVGTAGQRCTSTRRVIVHRSRLDELSAALIKAYKQVKVGDPLQEGVHMGPLIDRPAVEAMQGALAELKQNRGKVLWGGEVLSGGIFDAGTYVRPCLAQTPADLDLLQRETFAPLLYLVPYQELDQAIALHNGVPQGLSSAIFTSDLREAERFLSAAGSDCGLANVNLGTSGAEIGGAFGGEKDTGGGREAGSDAWKAYMRRQTNTVNWSQDLPLAQGIRFEVG